MGLIGSYSSGYLVKVWGDSSEEITFMGRIGNQFHLLWSEECLESNFGL